MKKSLTAMLIVAALTGSFGAWANAATITMSDGTIAAIDEFLSMTAARISWIKNGVKFSATATLTPLRSQIATAARGVLSVTRTGPWSKLAAVSIVSALLLESATESGYTTTADGSYIKIQSNVGWTICQSSLFNNIKDSTDVNHSGVYAYLPCANYNSDGLLYLRTVTPLDSATLAALAENGYSLYTNPYFMTSWYLRGGSTVAEKGFYRQSFKIAATTSKTIDTIPAVSEVVTDDAYVNALNNPAILNQIATDAAVTGALDGYFDLASVGTTTRSITDLSDSPNIYPTPTAGTTTGTTTGTTAGTAAGSTTIDDSTADFDSPNSLQNWSFDLRNYFSFESRWLPHACPDFHSDTTKIRWDNDWAGIHVAFDIADYIPVDKFCPTFEQISQIISKIIAMLLFIRIAFRDEGVS
nr:hypothetical protein [uncultured Tolumonas sp.]